MKGWTLPRIAVIQNGLSLTKSPYSAHFEYEAQICNLAVLPCASKNCPSPFLCNLMAWEEQFPTKLKYFVTFRFRKFYS